MNRFSSLNYKLMTLAVVCLFALTPAAPPAFAQSTIDVPLEDVAKEHRAKALFKILRCLVCQNQSIDDSNADLARDLRVLVRQRIAAGDSDDQTVGYIVDRYGDWVLLEPPFKRATLILWLGPLAILILAVGGIAWRLRRRTVAAPVAPVPLNADESRKLARLLDDDDLKDGPG
jgi:cytochrome c-type biogenesis protein CcmH